MKYMVLICAVAFSAVSQGAMEFLPSSKIPSDIQAEIQKTVAEKCVEIREMNWVVREVETQVFVDRVDNGLTDTYFTSTFEVDAKENDSNHSHRFPLVVRSLLTEANNGIHLSVDLLEGCRSSK